MKKEITVKKEKVGKFVYEQGESGKWKCPVCGAYVFDEPSDWDNCPVCGSLNSHVYYSGTSRMGQKMNFYEACESWRTR